MRRFAVAVVAILLMVSLVACGGGSEPSAEGKDQPAESDTQDAERSDVQGTPPAGNDTQDAGRSDTQGTTPAGGDAQDDEHTESENGGDTAIILNMNGTDIHARLYDNTAADAFLDLLPYTVTVSRATDDLCGSVSGQLSHDPAEDQDTWAIGEIGWFDGWFTILCDNEEGMPKRTRTIIGKIDEADIPVVQAFTGRVEIKVTLDESRSDPAVG